MKSTQTKFLDLFEAAVTRRGCELVVDYTFSNMGVARVQPVGKMRTLVHVKFDFQPRETSIDVTPSFVAHRPSLYTSNAEDLQEVIDDISAWLDKAGYKEETT